MALLLAGGVAIVGCELTVDEHPTRVDETHQQSHMGSLGNSLTAGFINGGIEMKGQLASFPNLLSQIMTGRAMQMPWVAAPGLGSESGMTPLFVDEDGDLTRAPLTVGPIELALNLTYPLPYDNLGIPGVTTDHILNVMFSAEIGNATVDLILRNAALPGGGTPVAQMARIQPDVLTAWSGNNEILGGALSGSPQSVDPMSPGYVVPFADFQADFLELCDRIAEIAPEMVAVGNIPPITAIPYTQFLVPRPLGFYGPRFVMEEDILSDSHADSVQLVLLTAPVGDCSDCFFTSCQFNEFDCDTIPDWATLTFGEVELLETAVADYNAFIATEVADRGWAMVDINAAFLALPTTPAGVPVNTYFPWLIDPLSGIGTKNANSAFSLDGVHPSEKGHAVLANAFLEAFNDHYGTAYEMVDVESIENVSGFELAPVGEKIEGGRVRITEEGRLGLRAVADMMAVRR
ncbi:hypothetical protein H8E07_04480 [bacterium]|nr:hypothetical protein [bacterium]